MRIEAFVPIATTVIGALLGYFLSRLAHKRKVAESERKEKQARAKIESQERLTFYQLMSVNLQASHDAFIEQCRIRNRLLRKLGHDPKLFDWETLEETLAEAYDRLDEEQRMLFDFIRGITEGPLFRRNHELLNHLRNNPQYFHELSEFRELQGHLELWFVKFESILKKRPDYCLVYVGVKEKKPFPKGIDKKVDNAIEQMKEVPESPRGER